MKYLCLICAVMEKMTEAAAEKHAEEYSEFTEAIGESGRYLGGNRLQPFHAAITVRVRNGRITATEGAFVETREQLGGYYLIEARDLNEAIQVASRMPGARRGCVEVRPVAEDGQARRTLGFADTDIPR
ncbi:MAG: YciI family protein [Nitrosospira sp.]